MFFSGVLVLTIANLLIKVIGLLFKIPITNIIGDEGMGYFNAAYTIYTWFYMISTAGLPVAVSVMISKGRTSGNFKEVKKIYKITMLLFVAIGLVGMLLMIFLSKSFADVMGSRSIYLSIIAIAPTLFFICISSAVRGYFQGYQNMFPTAVSQIIEALGKLILGILFANYAISKGYDLPMVAAYAISGLAIGAAGGMLYLLASKLLFKPMLYDAEFQKPEDTVFADRKSSAILKNLVVIAIPITISASVMSLTNLIDAAVVIRRLMSTGLTEELAVASYGNYTSLAVPMFNLPPVLIYPISYSIIPLLSSIIETKDRARAELVTNSALRVAALIAIPCALGMSVLSKPILSLFYKQSSVESAAPLLSILSLSVFFIGMLSITNAVLQANGQERKPIVSMLVGSGVKLVSSYILIGLPVGNGEYLRMYGTPISTFLCYLTVTLFNFYFLAKHVGIKPSVVSVFVKPFAAALVCAAAAIGSYTILNGFMPGSRLVTLASILVAAIVYVLLIFVVKAINKDDVMLLPKGKFIYGLLHKIKLM